MEVHACAADVEITERCLAWTDSKQTRVFKNRWGRKLHEGNRDKREIEEEQQTVQERIAEHAVKYSELLTSVGTIATTDAEWIEQERSLPKGKSNWIRPDQVK